MKSALVGLMVGSHRALFTIATALVGVSGSLVADDPGGPGNYLLLLGSLLLMYVEDECREIEQDSRAIGDGKKLAQARVDVFETHQPKKLYTTAGLSLFLFAAGVASLSAL